MHRCVKKEVQFCLGPQEFTLNFKSLLLSFLQVPPFFSLSGNQKFYLQD